MFNITSKTKKRIAKIGHGAVTLVSSFSIVVSSFTQVYAETLLIGDASAPGTGFITSSGNGTPVINIAPPVSGVSVNTYDDFNVDDKGLILNNSGVDGVSVIGAGVTANQRFVSEAANSGGIVTTAKTIVNEVTSASRSQINGQVEVFGDKAAVIIANPNGITCNGCDFINTSSSILTTGKPTINGSQVGLGVSKGTITIGPDGFKAGEQGGVFGRHVNINGAVSTNEQNPENTLVISGGVQQAGSLNFEKLSDTDIVAGPWTDAKTSPFAVDASEAGTLTSGKVRVVNVGAEKLGVNLYGEINAQSVEAHSTGHLFYRDITVTEGVTLYGGDIRQYGDLTAGGDVIINGDSFTLYDGRTLVTGQGEGVDGDVAITVKDFAVIAGEISGSTITLKALERAEGSDAPVTSITNNGFLLADGDFIAVAGVFKQERKIATEYDIYTDPVLKSYLQTYYAQLAAGGEQADIAATLIARAGAHEIIAEYIDDGATTSGTNVRIEATDGDILNKGGAIAATNNVVLKASENVINEFLALRSRLTAAEGCAGQNCGYKTDFHAAEILAGNDLTITAINGNIENRGSHLAAANNISLTAGNDIINSLKTSNYSAQQNVAVNIRYNVPIQSCHTGGKHDHVTTCTTLGYQTLQDWELHGTEDNILAPGRIVSLYGNVTVDAGRDFVSQGSEISAGRDIDIDADGQALFFSYTDDERNFVRYDKTINTNCNAKWGGCTQTTVQQTDNTYNLAVQNTDLIAETIDVDAKEDVVIIGSRFLASEDLDLTSATGNVLVGSTDYISSNDIAKNQIIPVGTVDVPSTVKTQRGDVITFTKLEDAADIEDFQGQFVNETADYATFLEEDNLLTAVEALRRAESGADIKDAARSVGVQSFVSLIDSGALADLTTEANEAYTTLQTTLETGLGSLWDEISGYNVQVKTQTEALEALVADTVVGNAAQQAAIDAALVVVAGDYAAAKASHEQAYQNRLAAIRASYDHLLTHQVLRHRQQWFGGKQPGYRTVAYWATVPNAHYVNLKNAANQVALNNRTAALQTAATQNALDVAAATALYSDEALRNQIAALQAAFETQTAEYAAQIETVHTTFETQLVDATNVVQNLRDQEALEAELGSSFVAKGTVNAGAPSLAAALTADAFKANEWYKSTPKLPEIQATYDARVAANEQAYQQLTAYIRAWHAPHLAAAVQGGLVAIHTQFANSQTSQLNDAAQARANTLQSAVEQKNAAEAVAKSLAVNSDGILEFTAFTEEGTSKALISDDKATQDKFLDATAWRYATAAGRKSRSPFNRLTAQEDLTIWAKNNALVAASDIDAKDQVTVTGLGGITAGDAAIRGTDIDLISGGNFTAGDLLINSSGDTSITSFGATKISTIAHNYTIGTPAANNILGTLSAKNWELRNGQNVTSHELSRINTGGDLKITSLGNLSLDGVQTTAGGDVSLTTNQNLNLTAPVSTITFKEGDVNNGTDTVQIISTPTYINSGGDFEAYAGNNAVLLGAIINADGALDLGAKNNVQLGARQNVYRYDYRYYKSSLLKTRSSRISQTHVTNTGTTLTAKGDVKVEAETGNLTTAGTKFTSTEGSVNLSATKGNIYAGTYTDTHDEQYINSSSSWGGLINSSSNTLINYTTQTGTAALAALNLSLQSGGNTTLIGTQLSAGQDLNINVGGDLRIEAAISSIRKEHFESKSGAVLATTLTENSEKETAAYTSFDAGGNLTVTVGGDTHVTLYRYEGEDTPELTEIYPEEIAALQALILHDQVLLDEYFFDETKALSPAFIAIATIAVTAGYGALLTGPLASLGGGVFVTGTGSSATLTAAGNALVATAASATINIANGAVSGDMDVGKILKDAAIAVGTSYLTSSLNLQAGGEDALANANATTAEKILQGSNEFAKLNPLDGILGKNFGQIFGEGSKLTVGNAIEGAFDASISSGVNSIAYGTDFGEGFTSSLIRTVVAYGLADAQKGIGDIFNDADGQSINGGEGSIGHVLLHGIAGCASAELTGADCHAGAAGGITQAILSGGFEDTSLSSVQQQQRAELIGALVGFTFSGGKAENVNTASSVALSGIINNRQLHLTEQKWIRENKEEFQAYVKDVYCTSNSIGLCNQSDNAEFLSALATGSLELADTSFDQANTYDRKDVVRSFIQYQQSQSINGGATLLNVSQSDRKNSAINIQYVLEDPELYALTQINDALALAFAFADEDKLTQDGRALGDFAEFTTQINQMSDQEIRYILGQFQGTVGSVVTSKLILENASDKAAAVNAAKDLVSDIAAENLQYGPLLTEMISEIGAKFLAGEPLTDNEQVLFTSVYLAAGATVGAAGARKFINGGGVKNIVNSQAFTRVQYSRGFCSFHGDMLVLTDEGLLPIRNVTTDMSVASRDPMTGAMSMKPVLAQLSNPYEETVSVSIRDTDTGVEQTILSNRIHPYFVQTTRAVVISSEGHTYRGPLENGYWVDAAELQPGDRLLNADGSWAEVVSVKVEDKSLLAYNLTVADFHTYFVAANENVVPVWVHNKCYDAHFSSRSAALRGVKETAGIPRSQNPSKVYNEFLRDPETGQNQLDGQGQLIETRNYVYDHPKYGQIVVKEHSVGHPAYSGKPASQPHFNIERYHGETNGKHQTSSISDVSGHYTFDGSGL